MPGVQTQHSDTHLFPAHDATVERLIEHDLFFANFVEDIKGDLRQHNDGQVSYVPVAIPNSIVTKMDTKVGNKELYGEFPLQKDLNGDFEYGDQLFEDTGESLEYVWRRIYVNQAGKTVAGAKGTMSDMRDANILKKNLKALYEMHTPALQKFFSSRKNANFVGALYDGNSPNVTTGLNDSPNGVGAVRVYHPNIYVNTVDATSGGTLTPVGTEGYSKTAAEMTTALNTNYSDMDPINDKFIDVMAIKCSELNIQKAVEIGGIWYWVAVIDRKTKALMNWSSELKATIRAAETGNGPKGILFGQLNFIYGEFLWVVDDYLPRAWNNDTLNFEGTLSYYGKPTFATGKDNSPVVVLGGGALGYLNSVPYHTRFRDFNFGLNSEYLALNTFGVSRGEYVSDANAATYYATGNATTTTLATAVEVTNFTSALFYHDNGLTVS
jgi:hypothetical protein